MIHLADREFTELVDYMKSNYGINLEKKRLLIESRPVSYTHLTLPTIYSV